MAGGEAILLEPVQLSKKTVDNERNKIVGMFLSCNVATRFRVNPHSIVA